MEEHRSGGAQARAARDAAERAWERVNQIRG